MMIVRWFLSRRVRHAVDACRHVRKLIRAQSDLLKVEAIERVQAAVDGVGEVLRAGGGPKELEAALNGLEKTVQKNLRPYPSPAWRENIEVFLVTGAIVLALRTFFVQPMAIPTGSAQPTLWGIVEESLRLDPSAEIPGPLRRYTIDKWWSGITYIHKVAQEDGQLQEISEPRLVFPFVRTQTFTVGTKKYRVFFPSSFERLELRCSKAGDPLQKGRYYRKGDAIVKLKVRAGDHLFVNRMIYNFRRPKRGEIIVFSSSGMPGLIQNTHYIKRLVGLPNERIRIGNDRHIIVNDERLDAGTPGFENVYSFAPKDPPERNKFSGHVNDFVAQQYGHRRSIAQLFSTESEVYTIPDKHYLAMGDNTLDSHDGRAWGAFPRDKLVGRSGFVFWPISERFGWGYR